MVFKKYMRAVLFCLSNLVDMLVYYSYLYYQFFYFMWLCGDFMGFTMDVHYMV
ncbi:hypothetical protein EV694_0809 [Volucribacter psittacicida]|uniref:Uncharacterized protein n=1 Tax=Volucribacter psittacicida TaxID=203482 RepID=A0A4R1G0D7_9PAST|nr:hypothetical protein EV694_0809 [Volucribacter psittacicida]